MATIAPVTVTAIPTATVSISPSATISPTQPGGNPPVTLTPTPTFTGTVHLPSKPDTLEDALSQLVLENEAV